MLKNGVGLSQEAIAVLEHAKQDIEAHPQCKEHVHEALIETVVQLCKRAGWPHEDARAILALNCLRQFCQVSKLRMPDLARKGWVAATRALKTRGQQLKIQGRLQP